MGPPCRALFFAILLTSPGHTHIRGTDTTHKNNPYLGDKAVFSKFGQLFVEIGTFSKEIDNRPWSSWWFPRNQDTLIKNTKLSKSPLYKYDKFAVLSGNKSSEALVYEQKHIYSPLGEKWSGLCDAWALAAIMEPEPRSPVTRLGIKFSIMDLKALLIKTYSLTNLRKIYGSRNNGGKWDNPDDIYPDEFHKFFQVQIFELGLPFIMDYDAGKQVWNVPVYKVTTRIGKHPKHSNKLIVRSFVSFASPFVKDKNFIGTKPSARIYDYELFGKWTKKGFLVTGGKWIGKSVISHPDFVVEKPDKLKRGSYNRELDINVVDRILGR